MQSLPTSAAASESACGPGPICTGITNKVNYCLEGADALGREQTWVCRTYCTASVCTETLSLSLSLRLLGNGDAEDDRPRMKVWPSTGAVVLGANVETSESTSATCSRRT